MDWARIMAPLSGGEADRHIVAAAAALAEPFGAEMACVHAPPDVADLIPWMGDGFMGGVQASAVDAIRGAAAEGAKSAQALVDSVGYGRKSFRTLSSPVWAALALQSRLSDVVVFDDGAAKGKGPLAEVFQQIVADEQRPTLVARAGFEVGGIVAVAWDGGKEASRAVRTAIPLLEKASKVVILSAPDAASREFDPAGLQDYLGQRGVKTEVHTLDGASDAAPRLLKAAVETGANLLVAGAFGHPRLQEFVFGGTTRVFLSASAPSMFISH
ncbi:MAG TPA: universal stress protein [Caulobacteraceae bacterium]|jgi:nucleotide-binding universal stress UspA family protein